MGLCILGIQFWGHISMADSSEKCDANWFLAKIMGEFMAFCVYKKCVKRGVLKIWKTSFEPKMVEGQI